MRSVSDDDPLPSFLQHDQIVVINYNIRQIRAEMGKMNRKTAVREPGGLPREIVNNVDIVGNHPRGHEKLKKREPVYPHSNRFSFGKNVYISFRESGLSR